MRISSKTKPQSLPWGRYLLIALGLSFLVIVVVLPLVTIFYQRLPMALRLTGQESWHQKLVMLSF
jgi:sulfate transport system permease protein